MHADRHDDDEMNEIDSLFDDFSDASTENDG